MSSFHPIDNNPLSVEDEQVLLGALDAFEAEVRSGSQPAIEAYLPRVRGGLQTTLLYDLIRLEWELRDPQQRASLDEYCERFPGLDPNRLLDAVYGSEARRTNAAASTIFLDRDPKEIVSAPAGVGFVTGKQPSIVAETSNLLRLRLQTCVSIVLPAIGVFFVRGLILRDLNVLWLRVLVLAILGACAAVLQRRREYSLGFLRGLEVLMLVSVGIQMLTIQVASMVQNAEDGDPVKLNAIMLFSYATWCVINSVYAVLIPNTWRRAAIVLTLTAVSPLITVYALNANNREVSRLVQRDLMHSGALLTFVATAAAIACTYSMQNLRKQLHQAKRFGQYRLVRQLGRGGMGEVFLAEHQLLKRPSAIKLIHPGLDTNAEVITRFEREVQATAGLSHWNTVEIFDYGLTNDGAFYYVMEYLDGMNLQELVDRYGPMPADRVVYFLKQICDALGEAHAAGMIHRDLKPANIFAARCGSRYDTAKLLDFGLVHEVESSDEDASQRSGRAKVVGTPRFMSPEQARGDSNLDGRSDIYSLGATAYYLLTGQPPFERASLPLVIQAHLNESPARPNELRAGIPLDLEEIVLRCLQKQPEDRFANAQYLANALEACACGSEWTAADATAWWQQVESKP